MFQHEGKIYPHIQPDISKWAIFQVSEDRDKFVEEVKEFAMDRILELHGHELPEIMGKTAYSELKRTKEEPWKVDPPKERKYWKNLSRRLANQSLDETEKESATDAAQELTEEVVERYAQEIVATFRIGTFKFARDFLSLFLGRLLNTADGRWIQGWFRGWFSKRKTVRKRLLIKGYVDQMRGLYEKGTVVLVPTHFSNLDSLVIGYAMEQVAGVPISTYGAGLNLFNTGYTAYFMNRLGVYRLDRRKKNPIYLNTLKANCVRSVLRGVPNLFFPGGTRSRSGAIETKLKLGLLGTAVEAQRIHYERGEDRKIFIVPMIMSYPFVLEAKYLIEQHLKYEGKERYIASKDNFHSLRAIIKFIWGLFSKGNQLTISLGKPMDVLGNFVDDDGNSHNNGRVVDTRDYFLEATGEVSKNLQREQEYTRILGERILERFHADNVVLASHLVSYAAFLCLERAYPKLDLFGLLRLPAEEFAFNRHTLHAVVSQLQAVLFDMEAQDKIKLSPEVRKGVASLIQEGIESMGNYHIDDPLYYDNKKRVVSKSFKMLYFYHNRLSSYRLKRFINWPENEPVLELAV